jgi:hypothetical protein
MSKKHAKTFRPLTAGMLAAFDPVQLELAKPQEGRTEGTLEEIIVFQDVANAIPSLSIRKRF